MTVAAPTTARGGGRVGLITRYRDRLPVTAATPVVSLGEGSTPLVEAPVLSAEVGARVLLKVEGDNPTGSFKDRGMTVAVSKALEAGAVAVVCASTGNTSASAAAYAARAGIGCVVIVPEGRIAVGKLSQAIAHGATVVTIDGNFDVALAAVRELAATFPLELVNSVNPFRIEGQKTAAFEVCDELGAPPDVCAIPVGNAGNITAWWRGFCEWAPTPDRGAARPAMWGFQAAGAAPIVAGHPIDSPDTVATAIRIGHPASWAGATAALTDSGGRIGAVSDDEILASQRWLASHEGVFCEPASAASVAGLRARAAAGELAAGATVVCVLTGHGLKDAEAAVRLGADVRRAPATAAGIAGVLDL